MFHGDRSEPRNFLVQSYSQHPSYDAHKDQRTRPRPSALEHMSNSLWMNHPNLERLRLLLESQLISAVESATSLEESRLQEWENLLHPFLELQEKAKICADQTIPGAPLSEYVDQRLQLAKTLDTFGDDINRSQTALRILRLPADAPKRKLPDYLTT